MGKNFEKDDAKKLIFSYEGKENKNELFVFFTLTKKFNFSFLKEIYPTPTYIKYTEILKNLNLLNENNIEDKTSSEILSNILSRIYSINIEWLRYFVTLAEIKNIISAAKTLNISISTLSKSISGIEETLQLDLFENIRNFEELTYAGKIVYEKSKKLLNSFLELSTIYKDLKSERLVGEINLAWFNTWGMNEIFLSIKNYMNKHPDVYFKNNFITWYKSEKVVSDGLFDIGFIPYEPKLENIEILGALEIEYAIVSSPQPKKNWDEFSYIVNCNSIERFSKSNVLNLWPEEEYKRNIIMECNLLHITVKFCEAGFGAAYLPVSFVKKELEKGKLAIVAETPFRNESKLYLICRKGIFISPALREFINELKNHFR